VRILVAEDDHRLAALLEQTLTEAGWEAAVVYDGDDALERGGEGWDVILLDWMLPTLAGIEVCRTLRSRGVSTPVMMLTARGDVHDRVDGLDAGADDYLPKPFDLDELLARLRALRRRRQQTTSTALTLGDLRLDPVARRVTKRGEHIDLSSREFDILHLMVSRAGHVVTRLDILEDVWDGETDLRSNVIDVHLAAIRSKIDRPYGTSTITTLRGVGYRLERPT
jgi:DNA-binding response OmpR family regulator